MAKALNLPQPASFLVTSVAKDSLADRMGLAGGQLDAVIDDERLFIGGDIVLGINGIVVTADRHAYRAVFSSLATAKPGTILRFKVMRAGKRLDLSLKMPPIPDR